MNTHNERILEQFSLQAVPFAQVPGHSDSIKMLIELSGAAQDSTVLDLAYEMT
jgi:hypothetical protein